MNCCFYLAIDRLPLGTVAAIEFLPVIALAALGARTRRNAAALALAVPGVYLLTGVRFAGEPLGVAFAFANAVLFALYIVLAHRVARHDAVSGIDGLGRVDADRRRRRHADRRLGGRCPPSTDPVRSSPASASASPRRSSPTSPTSSRCARLPRATYALMVSLLPATATVIGVVVLAQVPTAAEVAGVALVVAGVALHRDGEELDAADPEHAERELVEAGGHCGPLPHQLEFADREARARAPPRPARRASPG